MGKEGEGSRREGWRESPMALLCPIPEVDEHWGRGKQKGSPLPPWRKEGPLHPQVPLR
jgi:hypothetical protein